MPRINAAEYLPREECERLLTQKSVGRVVFVDDGKAVIRPVNYRMVDGSVVFRTSPTGRLARLKRLTSSVVFEVDDLPEVHEGGWSVLITGTASVWSDDESEEFARLRSWAPGDTSLLVRIVPDEMTGRSVHVRHTSPL